MSRATSAASHGKGIGVLTMIVSAVLLTVGLFVYTGSADTSASSAGWIWLAVASAALLGLGLGVWLLNRGMREGRILKSGLAGQASIVSVSETGMGVGGGDNEGGGTPYTPILRIDLRVVVPGHPPYETSVKEIVPLVRRLQLQPGLMVTVRADPKRLSRVVIDWEQGGRVATTATAMPGVAIPGMPGVMVPGVMVPGMTVPAGAVAGAPALVAPTFPSITLTGTETPDVLKAAVRENGLAGTAIVDSVMPAGATADGRKTFLLGMWITFDGNSPLRVDNAPTAVEERFAHKVAVGARVPARVALAGSAQATVLLWDEA